MERKATEDSRNRISRDMGHVLRQWREVDRLKFGVFENKSNIYGEMRC